MQCRECGHTVAVPALFCPSCGARLVAAAPDAASSGGVANAAHLGADVTQAQPIVPAAVRGPRPAAAPLHQAPVSHLAASSAVASPALAASAAATPAHAAPAAPVPAAAPKAVVNNAAPAHGVLGPNGGAVGKPVLPQPGEVLADRYRVEKFLGQGSLANAFLCRDLKAGNREVVLKAMHARKSAEPGLADSFLFLADSVAKYDHRGIARTLETGRMGDTPYYAMEWVSGVPLRMWLMERLTFENRVLPGLGIVRALIDIFEAIHERGCYGCLKPENVFIGLSGPVVMDFGAVGFLSPQEFEFNSYARRYLPYMAPELRQDWSNLIPHSDFYSLGAILYEILAGRAPSSPLRLPSELSDLFGIEADEIILKAMAPKPQDRFGTLEAFRHAVESLQAALLGAHPDFQPRDEGSRSMLAATSDSRTIHNPEETFADPRGPAAGPLQDPSFLQVAAAPADPSLDVPSWSRESPTVPGPGPGPVPPLPPELIPESEDPSETMEAAPFSAPTGTRESEAAHSQRRFTHSPRGAFPEGELPSPNALDPDGTLPAAGAWENLGGVTPEGVDAPVEEETPVPAWLWISIALAGCSMVVLSAYFGLLLPKF